MDDVSSKFIIVKKGVRPQEFGSFVNSLKEAKAKIAAFPFPKEWEVWGVVWPPKKSKKNVNK